jgi:hypothetical protein
MKNALISPSESPVKYTSGWTETTPPEPILTPIANSCRVAEVSDATFPVGDPLFWTPCADDVVADQFYYNTSDKEIYPVPPNVPIPEVQISNS